MMQENLQPNRVVAEPVSAEAFRAFGDVIEASGEPDWLINAGECGRYNDRARLEVDAAGRLGVSVFDSRCYQLPVTLSLVERHPLASQTFLPLSSDPYLVLVAPDADGGPGSPRAFIAEGGQGINLFLEVGEDSFDTSLELIGFVRRERLAGIRKGFDDFHEPFDLLLGETHR